MFRIDGHSKQIDYAKIFTYFYYKKQVKNKAVVVLPFCLSFLRRCNVPPKSFRNLEVNLPGHGQFRMDQYNQYDKTQLHNYVTISENHRRLAKDPLNKI